MQISPNLLRLYKNKKLLKPLNTALNWGGKKKGNIPITNSITEEPTITRHFSDKDCHLKFIVKIQQNKVLSHMHLGIMKVRSLKVMSNFKHLSFC